jgi:protocatechuate 3,4-dioxygenase beta subunit
VERDPHGASVNPSLQSGVTAMTVHDEISRRRMLAMSVAIGGVALVGNAVALPAQALRRTPVQVLGPFYPMTKPLDDDADLTSIRGKSGKAAGQVIHVMGRVINTQGEAVAGARIEIWQANAHGRYTHPSDKNPAPLDPNFEGYAVLQTDVEGRYRFKTIKPGAYPDDGGRTRPPHIHFDVAGRINRTVTQMYFAGDPHNATDRFLQSVGDKQDHLIVPLLSPTPDIEPSSLLALWDIVLEKG